VIDTVAESGEENVSVPIYVSNYLDTVAGFSLLLELDRPDLLSFDLNVDTAGTLVSGCELIATNHLGGDIHNLRIVGMANLPAPPFVSGIPPQLGSVPLVKMSVDVSEISDTMTNRVGNIIINHSTGFEFGFSDPNGETIGAIRDSVLDTAYYNCLEWAGDSCVQWEEVEGPPEPYDSMEIYYRPISYLDTTRVFIHDGSVAVLGGYVCGDMNDDGYPCDISDLVYLVDYMFLDGPAPAALASADCNGDGELDISDLVCFVEFMFSQGSAPICGP
jgi:hypothetical protein